MGPLLLSAGEPGRPSEQASRSHSELTSLAAPLQPSPSLSWPMGQAGRVGGSEEP